MRSLLRASGLTQSGLGTFGPLLFAAEMQARDARGALVRRRAPAAVCAALALALALGACGGGDDAGDDDGGMPLLAGKTETGMALEAEPGIEPSADPMLAELEAYRASLEDVAPVVYVRVTADNSKGDGPDYGRTLRVAPDLETYRLEGGTELEYACDALDYSWIPRDGADDELFETRADLFERLCTDAPPMTDGVGPGETQTYYLFLEQGIATRDFSSQTFVGPRDEPLEPVED